MSWPTDRELMGTLAPEEAVMLEEWRKRGPTTEHPDYLASKERVRKRMRKAKIEKGLASAAILLGCLGCVILLIVLAWMAFR